MRRKVQIVLVLLFVIGQLAFAANLTLKEAQSLALKHNLAFQLAQKKLEGGEASYRGAQAGIYPKINLASSVTKTKEQPPFLPVLPPNPDKIYSVQLSLQQPIYPGMGLGQLPLAAESQLQILSLERKRAAQKLEHQVATAYYNALLAQELVAVTGEAIEIAKVQLEQARAFYEAGVVLKTDILRSELAVGSLEQNLLAAENGAALAWASLEAAVGTELTGFTLVAPELPKAQLKVEQSEALAFALKNRAELLIGQEGVKQANLAVEFAKAGKRPQVALVGSYGWQGGELKLDDPDWSVTLSAQLPLFDAGGQNAKIEEAKKGAETTELVQKQLESGIALEIKQAHGALVEAQGRLPLAERAVVQAEEALRIASARYSEGIGLLTEVLEAQGAQSKARADFVSALYQYYQAVAQLELAIGVEIPASWEERE